MHMIAIGVAQRESVNHTLLVSRTRRLARTIAHGELCCAADLGKYISRIWRGEAAERGDSHHFRRSFGQSARFMAGLWLSRAGLHEYERDTFVEASWLDIDVMDSYLPVPP